MTRHKRRLFALGLSLITIGIGLLIWRLRWPELAWIPGLDSQPPPAGAAGDPFDPAVQRVIYLDQGWSQRERNEFYARPQGSLLIPYAWFLALEQVDNSQLFRDEAHILRLRFLPQSPSASNPDGLPVGFAKEPRGRGHEMEYLGLTCAACHTTEVHFQGAAYRIDGGPSLADAQTFIEQLTLALQATLDDPAKFDRFSAQVLRRGHTAWEKEELRKELRAACAHRHEYNQRNHTDVRYGYGRLDAFGYIMNDVLAGALGVADESQRRDPDAPVSYPFLWDTPHHDYVQWNAVAKNQVSGSERLGGLARNVGEVLGVFGQFHVSEPKTATALTGYRSSVRIADLIALENLVRKLHSPRWPDEFPPINESGRAAGESLFRRYCQRCHHSIERTDPNRSVRAVKIPIDELGTDPRMATNFAQRRGKTGKLQGRRALFVAGSRFGPDAEADDIFVHVIVGIIMSTPSHAYTEMNLRDLRRRYRSDVPPEPSPLVYKSRPLNGIWATAPYLHNGSVPNLYELLLPATKRSTQFYVGRREFDPKHVGFRTDSAPGLFLFRACDEQGRPIPGNSNRGHEYGTGLSVDQGGDGLPPLTDEQRWQIIEYLKSL